MTSNSRIISKQRYKKLEKEIRMFVNFLDPVNLGPGELAPEDEYDFEVHALLPKLLGVRTQEEIVHLVKEEFNRAFGPEILHKNEEHYHEVSKMLFQFLKEEKYI